MRADEAKTEILDTDDAKVAQLLAGLKRVEAPANFEFRLKARLANATPPARTFGFVPSFVKFASPVALVAAVSSVLFLNSSNSPESTVSTAGVAPQINVSEVVKPAASFAPTTVVEPEATVPVVAANPNGQAAKVRQSVPPAVREPKEPDRSQLKAVNGAKIIVPRGIDPNLRVLPVAPQPESKSLLPASDVLRWLGIDSVYEGGWKVRAIKKDSPADHAGVKADDILEAIDDNQLGKDAMFKSGNIGRVIKVKRDGKSVELTLANK
jgi:hypothetical protein